jgi:hypothetical protein
MARCCLYLFVGFVRAVRRRRWGEIENAPGRRAPGRFAGRLSWHVKSLFRVRQSEIAADSRLLQYNNP